MDKTDITLQGGMAFLSMCCYSVYQILYNNLAHSIWKDKSSRLNNRNIFFSFVGDILSEEISSFQFDCTNTLNDQILENVKVEMEPSEADFEVVCYVPRPSLAYNAPGTTYTLVKLPDDASSGWWTQLGLKWILLKSEVCVWDWSTSFHIAQKFGRKMLQSSECLQARIKKCFW